MKKLILVALLSCSLSAFAQSQPEPQRIIDEFFSLYKEKGSDTALDYLFGTNEWLKESKEQIENVKLQINTNVISQMGNYFGYDLISKKSIGTRVANYTYILRYDKQPIRVNLLFYNPDKQWRLQNFSFDDNIKEELDEATNIYSLKEIDR